MYHYTGQSARGNCVFQKATLTYILTDNFFDELNFYPQ